MTTAVQHRRGTTAEHATFTGLEGEVTIDTTKDTAVIHDGVLAGGVPLARENLANVTPSGLATITGASTASDDKFFIYDQSATTLKSITRAELNNAMEIDALANVTITGGTINGTTIGNTTAAAGTFTQANFADNAKAIFGAGSDLQIWHNGTDSFIKETGVGDLKIQANKTVIQSASGADSFLVVDPANGVQLSHSVSGTVGVKLATTATGIDVTGKVVSDGFQVGNTQSYFFVNSSGALEQNGIRLRSDNQLHITVGNATRQIIASNGDISFSEDTGTTAKFYWNASAEFLGVGTTTQTANGESLRLVNGLFINTLGTNSVPSVALGDTNSGLFAPIAGEVAIATNGGTRLTVSGTGIDVTGTVVASDDITTNGGDVNISGAQPRVNFLETDTTNQDVSLRLNAGDFLIETRSDAGAALGDRIRAAANGDVSFYENTGTTAKFYWDASAESLGIGTSSPATTLDVSGGTSNQVAIFRSTDAIATIGFADNTTPVTGNLSYVTLGAEANAMVFNTNLNERMRITSAGNVGINTDSPATMLELSANNGGQVGSAPNNTLRFNDIDPTLSSSQPTGRIEFYVNDSGAGGTGVGSYIEGRATGNVGGGYLAFADSASGATGATESMRLINGNLQFNSGYGSVATAYGCRAWVNFNGTGTVAIRGSGNVSSITDNSAGNHTINFITAMPDVNYSYAGGYDVDSTAAAGTAGWFNEISRLTGSLRIVTNSASGVPTDCDVVLLNFFR